MPHAKRNKVISKLNYLPPSPPPRPTPILHVLFKGESLLFPFWTSTYMCSVGAGLGKENNHSGPVMCLRDRTFPGSCFPEGDFSWIPRTHCATLVLHWVSWSRSQSCHGIYPKLRWWWCGFSSVLHFFKVFKERISSFKCGCPNGNIWSENRMSDVGLSPSYSSPSIHHG